MRHDIDEIWIPWQNEVLEIQVEVDKKAQELYDAKNPQKTIEYLNGHTDQWGNKVIDKAWELGDYFWTKYDEKF